MATVSGPKGPLFPTTYVVGAAVVKNRFLKLGADGDHVIQATAASVNVGLAYDNQDTVERTVAVIERPGDTFLVEAGATFGNKVRLTSDASGRAVLATTGQAVSAVSREPATAVGQLIVCELVNSSIVVAP